LHPPRQHKVKIASFLSLQHVLKVQLVVTTVSTHGFRWWLPQSSALGKHIVCDMQVELPGSSIQLNLIAVLYQSQVPADS
jgi:hypothetical protein